MPRSLAGHADSPSDDGPGDTAIADVGNLFGEAVLLLADLPGEPGSPEERRPLLNPEAVDGTRGWGRDRVHPHVRYSGSAMRIKDFKVTSYNHCFPVITLAKAYGSITASHVDCRGRPDLLTYRTPLLGHDPHQPFLPSAFGKSPETLPRLLATCRGG